MIGRSGSRRSFPNHSPEIALKAPPCARRAPLSPQSRPPRSTGTCRRPSRWRWPGRAGLGQGIAVDQRVIDRGQTGKRAGHGQQAGAADVEAVDLGDAGPAKRHLGMFQKQASKALRRRGVSRLESFNPSGMTAGSSTTAAAVTGPANGPRPTSSMPATRPPRRVSCDRSGPGVMPSESTRPRAAQQEGGKTEALPPFIRFDGIRGSGARPTRDGRGTARRKPDASPGR